METIFDKIINDKVPNWKVWQDTQHIAFLTPFGNVRGATVVIPKANPGEWAFDLDTKNYLDLCEATYKVANILEKTFETKIGMIIEGTGVPYAHTKLFPMHNLYKVVDNEHAVETAFYETYPGYLSSQPGPMMSDKELNKIQEKVLSVQKL